MANKNILEKVFSVMTVKTITIGLAAYFILQYIIYSTMPSGNMLAVSFISVMLMAYLLRNTLFTPTYQTHFSIGVLGYLVMTMALIFTKQISAPPLMYTEVVNALELGGATTLAFKILKGA